MKSYVVAIKKLRIKRLTLGLIFCLSLLGMLLPNSTTVEAQNPALSNWITNLSEGVSGTGAPDRDPEIAVVGNIIHTMWSTQNADGTYALYYKRSTDNGLTWENKKLLYTSPWNNSLDDPTCKKMAVDSSTGNVCIFEEHYTPTSTSSTWPAVITCFRSTDGGATFLPPQDIFAGVNDNIGTSDDIYSIYATASGGIVTVGFDVHLHYWPTDKYYILDSTDGGATFNQHIAFNNPGLPSIEMGYNYYDVQRTGNNIYVLYTEAQYYYGQNWSDVYLAVSNDGGQSFNQVLLSPSPVQSNNLIGAIQSGHYVPKISIAGDNVNVIWTELDASGYPYLVLRHSADKGLTFGPMVNLYQGQSSRIPVAAEETISALGNYVYVVFVTEDNTYYQGINAQIQMRRSTDGGITFQSIQTLSAPTGTPYVGTGWFPVIQIDPTVADGSKLHVLWNGPSYVSSSDGGVNFTSPVLLVPSISCPISWNNPKIAVGKDGAVHFVVEGTSSGYDSDVLYRRYTPPPNPSGSNTALYLHGDPGYSGSIRYDNMQIPASPYVNLTSAMSVEAWINPNRETNCAQYFAVKLDSNNGNYALGQGSDGTASCVINTPDLGVSGMGGGTSIANGTWAFVTMTYDASAGPNNLRLYVNGSLVNSQTRTGNIQTGQGPLFVGGVNTMFYSNRPFNGAIDELSIWNRALSPQEISNTMIHPLTGQESGLQAYYNFNNTTKDLTGHGNDGVLMYQESFVPSDDPQLSTRLVFSTQPSMSNTMGIPFSRQPVVTVQDSNGNTLTGYNGPITLTITPDTNTASANLIGATTMNATSGIATFSGIAIDKPGTGYTLAASTNSLSGSPAPATSSQLNVTVDTSTALISSANPANYVQSVTFTANISTDVTVNSTPTGTVTFMDNGNVLPSGIINLNGTRADYTTSSLTIGSHSITAQYSGDSNFNPSISPVLTQVVNSTTQGNTISGHIYDRVTGSPISGATVVLPNPTPGQPAIASANTTSDGSYFFTGLTSGSYRVLARDSGHAQRFWDDVLLPKDATSVAIDATTGAAGIDFSLEAGSAISGNLTSGSTPLTNVSAGIQSMDNPSLIWGVLPNVSGVYSLNVPDGTYKVYAPSGLLSNGQPLGSGDTQYQKQYYNNQSLLANAGIVTVFNGNPSSSTGINFNLVSSKGSSGTISGHVYDRATGNPIIGATVTLPNPTAGQPALASANTTSDGSYSFSGLTSGPYKILARASGYAQRYWNDTWFNSQAISVSVNSTAGVKGIDFQLEAGNAISGIISSAVGPLSTVSIAVQNVDNPSNIWIALPKGDGSGSYSTNVPNGNYKVYAPSEINNSQGAPIGSDDSLYIQKFYNNRSGLSSADIVTVSNTNPVSSTGINFNLVYAVRVATSIAITSSVNPSAIGQSVPFTAVITCNGSPTGSITFMDNGNTLGMPVSINGTKQVTLNVASLTFGSHSISASYSGDSNFIPSVSGAVTQIVNAPSLACYSDSAYINPCTSFASAVNHVYVKGTSFAPGTYQVAYFDGSGINRSTQSVSVNASGILLNNYQLNKNPAAISGTWHVLVQPSSGFTGFGSNYTAITASPNTYGVLSNDSFSVASTAISELPSAIAALGVAGLCIMAFYWLRRRRETQD